MLFQTVFVLCYLFITTESFRKPLDLKIIGGTDVTNRSEFAYQAALCEILSPLDVVLRCGASIIHEKFALTAASCVEHLDVNLDDMIIVTGYLNINVHTIVKYISWIYTRQDYNESTHSNDIALIEIYNVFTPWTENVRPISLKRDETTSGSCIVSGWGSFITDTSVSSALLISAEVSVTDWQMCYEMYLTYTGKPIPEATICAGEKGKGPCRGDVGAPLVCSGQLAGIVSYASGCGETNVPGVYTDVAAYVEWIEDIISPKTSPIQTETTTTTTTETTTPTTIETTTPTTTKTKTPTTAPITTTTKTPTPTKTTTATATKTTISSSTIPDPTITTPGDGKGFGVANRDSLILWLLATVTIITIF